MSDMPKDAIKYVEGEVPPRGYLLGKVITKDDQGQEHTELYWVNPMSIRGPKKPQSVLTPEQVKRLRRCYNTLCEHDPGWERWQYNFSCDQIAEREILVYECLSEAYRAEILLRNDPPPNVRKLLYGALLTGINGAMTVNNVLAITPQCKGLSKLGRALRTLRQLWAEKYQERYNRLPLPRPPENLEDFQ